ncbi:unnamed protein product [Durusdinium trenchii]|uniref:Uncharacterized protein n=1 Tax=Durusdinium trenchii TaxID=1381693 RepID=A0ABP0R206_9DINO
MLRGRAADAYLSAYNQAIAVKCRSQAPIAGSSLDRAALKGLAEATAGSKVEALVCFCCGGVHPYVEEVAAKGNINWHRPLQRDESDGQLYFLEQPLQVIESLLGLQTYLNRYNAVEPRPQVKLTDHETFEDWRLKLPELEDGMLLCCPDHHCCQEHSAQPKALCEKCWLPICNDCLGHLSEGKLPPLSYANDMWTGYGLERIYQQQVKRLVMSFVFTYCLPRQTRLVDGLEENSDNEDVEDDLVDFTLGGDDLLQATLTHVRGSGRREQATEINSCSDVDVDGGEGALAEQADPTRLYDMTMELFGLSDAIWQREGKTSDPEANRRYEQLLKQVAAGDPFDHDTAKAAARASSKAGENASQTGKSGLIGRVDAEVEAGRRGGAS